MGRAPCCDKANVKKGPWSPEEDAKLKSYIEQHGIGGNWIALPQKIGLKRCGKSCRLRWLNYLRPNIKHGGFSEEEDNIICSLYISIGSRWSIIAAQLPGRTDNDIKNYWNTRLKKKLLGKQRKDQQHGRRNSSQKQEMLRKGMRENITHMVSSSSSSAHNSNQNNPYWPELPVHPSIPYSNEEPRFSDHASIRKLLIKLGGRFSDEDDQLTNGAMNSNLQYPLDNNSSVQVQPLYHHQQQQIDMLSSTMPETQHNIDGAEMSTLQEQNTFQAELEQMIYNNPQKLDGLEFIYGDVLMNHRMGNTCGGSSDWGEMNSLLFPPFANSNCGGLQQGTLQERAIDQLRYHGQ